MTMDAQDMRDGPLGPWGVDGPDALEVLKYHVEVSHNTVTLSIHTAQDLIDLIENLEYEVAQARDIRTAHYAPAVPLEALLCRHTVTKPIRDGEERCESCGAESINGYWDGEDGV